MSARAFRPHGSGVGSSTSVLTTLQPSAETLHAWDRLVDRTPGTDVTQLSEWGRLRTLVGFSPLYMFAYRAGDLVGGALIMRRWLPGLGYAGYVPYGPIISGDVEERADVGKALADEFLTLSWRPLRMLFVQPPEGADNISAELLARGFRPSSAGIAPAGSVRIDLSEDLTVIRGRFGRRLRSWPERWQRRGVVVREGDAGDIPLLTYLISQSARHHGYQEPSDRYVAALYTRLARHGHAALFIGELNGNPVAADLVTMCGDMIRGRLTGLDRLESAVHNSVPAAIRWQIIQWGKSQGYRWLDFGGLCPQTLKVLFSRDATNERWAAVDQPKLTFGGTPYRYPPAVEVINPVVLRWAYDRAMGSAPGRQVLRKAQSAARWGLVRLRRK